MRSRRLVITSVALLALPMALLLSAQQQVPPTVPATEPQQNAVSVPGGEPDCPLAIVPLWQKVDGRSYAEWTVAWWHWATAFPPDKRGCRSIWHAD